MAVGLSALRGGPASPPERLSVDRFCQRPSKPQGHSATGRIMEIEKELNDLIETQTSGL
jgi:hypothetical protein